MTETTCINNPCASVEAGWDPDMSLGDVCAACLCRECERCGEKIALDEETQIADGPGYIDVCERCVSADDVHYDLHEEVERQAMTRPKDRPVTGWRKHHRNFFGTGPAFKGPWEYEAGCGCAKCFNHDLSIQDCLGEWEVV